jgi:hypothetical protein
VAFVLAGSGWTSREAGPDPDVPPGGAPAPGEQDDEEDAQRSVRMLREAGWTVLPVSAGDGLAELWQRADRYRSREEAGAR